MSRGAQKRLVVGVLLALAVLAAFWPVLGCGFTNLDDSKYVTRNRFVQQGPTGADLLWAFTTFHASNWHPLTWMSHMLDWSLYEAEPMGHHLTSLLLHLTSTILLFLLLDRATGKIGRSALVAALFGVHPLRVESVAWVAERKDVLSGLFFMLACLAYLAWARNGSKIPRALVIVLAVLGLMAKPMLVTLPFVLLLLDYWPLGRLELGRKRGKGPSLGSLVIEKAPLFVLSAASSAVTWIAQNQRGSLGSLDRFPLPGRLANALVSAATYLWKTIWPRGLAVFYPYPEGGLPPWKVGLAASALVLITVAAVAVRRDRKWAITGWLWFLGMLVPVIGLVQVGRQAMADRYTYLPLVGVFIVVVWGGEEMIAAGLRSLAFRDGTAKHLGMAARGGVAVLVLAPLVLLTRSQCTTWSTSQALFRHALSVTANNYLAHNNLGAALAAEGKDDEALAEYSEAVRIFPGYALANHNLGKVLLRKGNLEGAIGSFSQAVRSEPDSAEYRMSLAKALVSTGRGKDAIEHFEAAVRLAPADEEARVRLGMALAGEGRREEASAQFVEALRLAPNSWEAHFGLAEALVERGDIARAEAHVREVIRLKPDLVEAHVDLAVILSKQRRWSEAAGEFREALRLAPDHGKAHEGLATMLFNLGRYQEAWREVEAARQHGVEPSARLVEMLVAKRPSR